MLPRVGSTYVHLSPDDFTDAAWRGLCTEQVGLSEQVDRLRRLHKEVQTAERDLEKRIKSTTAALKATPATIAGRSITSFGSSASIAGTEEEQNAIHLRRLVDGDLSSAKEYLPAMSGKAWLLNMFIGSMNVRMTRPEERYAYKERYELYKRTITFLLAPLAIACIFVRSGVLDSLFFGLTALYYLNVSLRESILRLNGSTIKLWWVLHHLLSEGLSVTLLTWPFSDVYDAYQPYVMMWGLFTVFLQYLQTKYQTERLYTLRAMGKVSAMEVANSDTTAQVHFGGGGLAVLLPFLLVGQIWQIGIGLYLGVLLLDEYERGALDVSHHNWQPFVVMALFAMMGIGNLVTTLLTIKQKLRKRRHSIRIRKSQ